MTPSLISTRIRISSENSVGGCSKIPPKVYSGTLSARLSHGTPPGFSKILLLEILSGTTPKALQMIQRFQLGFLQNYLWGFIKCRK